MVLLKFFTQMQCVQENVNSLAGTEASHSEPREKWQVLSSMYHQLYPSIFCSISCPDPNKEPPIPSYYATQISPCSIVKGQRKCYFLNDLAEKH